MWWLAVDGFHVDRFRKALQLLQETAFTTNVVEQNHTHAKMLTKLHGLYEMDSLRQHALLLQARHLIGDSQHQRYLSKLQRRRNLLLAKQPEKRKGFIEFKTRNFSDGGDAADLDHDGAGEVDCPLLRSRVRAKRAAAAWHELPPETRERYAHHARTSAKDVIGGQWQGWEAFQRTLFSKSIFVISCNPLQVLRELGYRRRGRYLKCVAVL